MRALDIYINSDMPEGQACLLRGATAMEGASAWVCLLRDAVLCRLWFQKSSATVGGLPSSIGMLGAGEALIFGAKLASNLSAADFVFSQTDWSEVTDGTNTHYEGVLDFRTAELAAGFTSASQLSVNLLIDVRCQNADQTRVQTYQFPGICYRNVILGTEGVQVSGNPPYPTPQQLAESLAALAPQGDIRIPDRDNNDTLQRLVIKGGQLQLESIE